MPATKDIRNLAVVGHGSSGKTTLVERILFDTKTTSRFGRVVEGTSALDVAQDERDRGSSIDMHLAHASFGGAWINLIDTPGAADFRGDAVLALAAVEAALVVVDAKDGVKVNTRKIWQKCQEVSLPRFIAVSRMDAADVDFDARMKQIQQVFGDRCLPLYLPDSNAFKSVLSVLEAKDDRTKSASTKLVEAAIEADEALMTRYLEGEQLDQDQVRKAIVKAVVAGKLHPVVPVSAETGVGIAALLDTIVRFFPSPADRPPATKKDGKTTAQPAIDGPFSGYVLKTTTGESGRLSIVRVMTGTLKESTPFLNTRDGKAEKGGHLTRIQSAQREKLDHAVAGEIVGIPKMDTLHRGDTIAAVGWDQGRYEGPKNPVPLSGLAVHPKNSKDAPKLLESLNKIAEEDATFKIVKDAATGQLVVEGLSALHLNVALARMKTRSKVEVESERRKVPYRETLTIEAIDRYRHKKQSGGSGEFAEVELRVAPNARDKGFEYVWEVVGMNVSRTYQPSIEKGIVDVMQKGVIAGYPVVDVIAAVTDGKEHPVDSKDRAFQKAGREAFKLCMKKAKPVLLEPIVKIDVTVPGDSVGDVTADLAGGRRGQITNTVFAGDTATISAQVPLAEVMEYDHQLRAMTGGEGTFSTEPSHYDIVPGNIQQAIVAEYEKHKVEEQD